MLQREAAGSLWAEPPLRDVRRFQDVRCFRQAFR